MGATGRYYQVARCFPRRRPAPPIARPEFTQLDIEVSFLESESILDAARNA